MIAELGGPVRLVVQLFYGSGLRLLEELRLRVKDANFARHEVFVRDPKGRRDRLTTLPRAVEPDLKQHLERVHALHERDVDKGFGEVVLPGALARKLPNAAWECPWQWVFPATKRYVVKEENTERRHHLHGSAVQRAVREAALK